MYIYNDYAILSVRGTKGVPRKGVLNIGQHEGLNMSTVESKTQSNQLLLPTPIP